MLIPPFLMVLFILGLYLVSSIKILTEYGARCRVPAGQAAAAPEGARRRARVPPDRPDGPRRVAHRGARRPAAGRHHARQRVGQGERGGLLPRHGGATRAIVEVENYNYATSQLSQTTLRSVLGQVDLDDLLSKREHLNQELQQILDQRTILGRQGLGGRGQARRLPGQHAAGDGAAGGSRARKRRQDHPRRRRAAGVAGAVAGGRQGAFTSEPTAITLRYLQTLTEIAAEKNSTIIFPLPMELLGYLKPGGAGK